MYEIIPILGKYILMKNRAKLLTMTKFAGIVIR